MNANNKRHLVALEKTKQIIQSAKQGLSKGLYNDCRKIGLDIRKFHKHLKEYSELYKEWNNIDWRSIYKPTCAICKTMLSKTNYRNFDEMIQESKRRFILQRKRFCNLCSQYQIKKYRESLQGTLVVLLNSSRQRNKQLDFDIDFLKNLYKKQNGKCFYSGIKMTFNAKSKYKISIDRLNSEKGYQKNNIVLCCWVVNDMKKNLNLQEFIKICKEIVYTSQTCNKCGFVHKLNRHCEIFTCRNCGYKTDADYSASVNILKTYLAQQPMVAGNTRSNVCA